MWQQNNRSDILGTLWSSFNLNLTDKLGRTKISPRMMITTNGIANFGTPVSFREYLGDLYAMAPTSTPSNIGLFIATGGFLRNPFVASTATGVSAINFSCDYSDMEVFNGRLVLSGSDTQFLYYEGGGYVASSSVLTASCNHKMLNFSSLGKLYIAADQRKIISVNSDFSVNTSGNYTLDLSTSSLSLDLFMTSMFQVQNLIWITTINQYNNKGYMYSWDGVTTNSPTTYPIDSRGVLTGIAKDGTAYILDMDGKLMYFNGQAFVLAPFGQLPVNLVKYLKNPVSTKNDRWLHPNGMTLVNGRINILINNENYDNMMTIEENLPSGMWEYDQDIGWYHKASLSTYDLTAGAPVITDYGQNRISRAGALVNIKYADNTSPTTVGTLICGADYFADATTVKSASFINDSLDLIQKAGYFVTTKQEATDGGNYNLPVANSMWDSLYTFYKNLLNITDRITTKYRTLSNASTEAVITWISQNSFTTTTNISQYWTSGTGGEVEVLQGKGSGLCSHITSIVNNSGTYTVVVDENYPNVSGTAKARFQNWKKLDDITQNNQNFNSDTIGVADSLIQIKICALFTGGNEIQKIIITNVNSVPAK
jgi:hypothetical protein